MTEPPRRSPLGVAPYSSGRVPGPTRGPILRLSKTQPIVYLDPSWTSTERGKILAALQQISGDRLTLTGLQVFSDGSRIFSGRTNGNFLLGGLQHATRKVIIVPQTGSFLPETKESGSDVLVELAFSSGGLSTFHFFTITHRDAVPPGVNAIEKSPGYICLAHELGHAFRILHGLPSTGSKDHEFNDPSGNRFKERVRMEELIVVGIEGGLVISENDIRDEQFLGSRCAYASPTLPLDRQGVTPLSAVPSWWPDCPTP